MCVHLSLPRCISCASRGCPQKHFVEEVARQQGPLEQPPGEQPMSFISQAPQTQAAKNGVCDSAPATPVAGEGGERAAGRACSHGLRLDLNVNPRAGRWNPEALGGSGTLLCKEWQLLSRQSLARAIAWNLFLASSPLSPRFLSGCQMSASRL